MILIEGRKEDAYKKYQESIDRERKMISIYMDNASAYDFLIDEPFIKETNYKFLNDILDHHYLANYYSSDVEQLPKTDARDLLFRVRSEVDKIVKSLIVYEKYRSQFQYPDFKQYINKMESFFQESSKIETKAKEKQEEKTAKKEVDKIFDNDSLLIVKPKSFVSSCYYGAGTRWCTTMANQPSYFNQYTSNGNLYYLILKNVDRTNKFYKMAIYVPKNKDFNKDSIWYDSTDERLTEREKESVLAQMPKEAFSAMFVEYIKSSPEKTPMDILYGLLTKDNSYATINMSIRDFTYKYKNGEIKLDFGSIGIVDSGTNLIEISIPWRIIGKSEGGVEEGSMFFRFQAESIQMNREEYLFGVEVSVRSDSDRNDRIVDRMNRKVVYMSIEMDLKTNESRLMYKLWVFLAKYTEDFFRNIESKLKTDETLIVKYPPTKAKSYGHAGYTFTGKGVLTKAFMKYLLNIPEGKVGNKNDFLTQLERKTGPGQYSSFFASLASAGITERQGKSGLVKGPNFDKFYKKVFE